MAYRLKVSARAVREIGEAYEWYEEQLHGLGAEFLDALDTQLRAIAQTPLWGLARTMSVEHPKLWGGIADLDHESSASESAVMATGCR